MRNTAKARPNEIADLAKDAHALMEATANVAGHQVEKARKRLAIALKRGKATGEDLVDATTDIAGDNIQELRDRITAALDHGKDLYDEVHDDVVDRAKAADLSVRENPYQVMGIALGVGAIVGFIYSLRSSRNER